MFQETIFPILGGLGLLAVMLVIVHGWQHQHHSAITLSLARGLRRFGRWFWALGEGLEYGFLHSQRVKQQISLDLEPRS
jgi:hypothetical protein